MSPAPPELVPAAQRPVPLQRRTDLRFQQTSFQGDAAWTVKDPVQLKFHRLLQEQYLLLMLLDGRRTLVELRDALQHEFPRKHWKLSVVQAMVSDLHAKRLAVSCRYGQGRTFIRSLRKQRWAKIKQVASNFLFLKLPGWDPTPVLRLLGPLVSWAFHPAFVLASLLFIVGSWVWVGAHFAEFQQQLPAFHQFFGWPNLLYLWFTLALIKVLHEFGHGLTCRHFGAECHEIGIMLLVFFPTLYCEVSDSWMLPSKWRRIAIAAAGMWVELILSGVALLVWWNTKPGLMHHLALNVFFVTAVTTVIFNANPLMRLDGYYILSDLLEIPNLGARADRLRRETFAKTCLGIESRPDPFSPRSGRFWFVAYALASPLYRWVLIASIGLFLYTVLKPYRLQSLGVTIAALSVLGMLVRPISAMVHLIRQPREKPLSRFRMAATLTVLALLIAGVSLIPVPLYLEAPFTVQPHQVQHIYTTLPGTLTAVHVQSGEFVEPGQLLAELTDEELQERLLELQLRRDLQQVRVQVHHAAEETAQRRLAEERARGLVEQIAELETKIQQLQIRSAVAGTVVAGPAVPPPTVGSIQEQLPRWYDRPLEPQNIGCFLQERVHVASIAPHDTVEAVLLIDQGDRNDLAVGQPVRLKLDHLPDRIFSGTIESISPRHQEYAEPALSNKAGGTLSTVTDQHGRERLPSVAYEAIVTLPEDCPPVPSGARGRARCVIAQRSLGEWLWRQLRRTVYFRL